MIEGKYVDGFVISIPEDKTEEYKKIAEEASVVWKKFGAIDYKECKIEDENPEHVTFTFRKMAKAEPDESIWFSYIVYESREHRDEVNKKVMAFFDEKYGKNEMNMPFDMKRFSYGGFKVEVSM